MTRREVTHEFVTHTPLLALFEAPQSCILCRATLSSPQAFEAHYVRLHYCGAFIQMATRLLA